MRQRLILHIGTHKTGSTSIQNYLYYNRLWLRSLGVYYPLPLNGSLFYANNHSDLRDTALSEGKPRGAEIHPRFGRHDALLGRYIRAIKEVGKPVNILSAEGWSSHLNRYARRLAPLSQHFDVKVIAFMRRPDYWIEKFYSQRIANFEHAETRRFSAFLDQAHIETYLYNRHRMFGWWAKAFGGKNVTVVPYEPAIQGFDLIEYFLREAGDDSSLAGRLFLRQAHANRTLSARNAEVLRQRFEEGSKVDKRLVRALKRDQEGSGCFLGEGERSEILKRAESDMARICEDYVRDGREELFPANPEEVRTLEKCG